MFRTVDRFLSQFGISDKPAMKHWHNEVIKDDVDKRLGIKKFYVSFAGSGPNSRSTQIFIAFEDLNWLGPRAGQGGKADGTWETPFGNVIFGFDVLDSLYKGKFFLFVRSLNSSSMFLSPFLSLSLSIYIYIYIYIYICIY